MGIRSPTVKHIKRRPSETLATYVIKRRNKTVLQNNIPISKANLKIVKIFIILRIHQSWQHFLQVCLCKDINLFLPLLNTIQGFLDSFPKSFALTEGSGILCFHLNLGKASPNTRSTSSTQAQTKFS